MKWDKLKDISLKFQKRWDRGIYLKSYVKNEALFPLWCPLKGPTSSQMNSNFDKSRTWAAGIHKEAEKHHITIVMRDVNHRQLGKNSIPRGFFIENIDSLAVFLGKKNELRVFLSSLKQLESCNPELREWAAAHPLDLIKSEPVIEKLLSILHWRMDNPSPGVYLRQLSLPGIDTKFIETHRKVLGEWFDMMLSESEINDAYRGIGQFERRYGFKSKPLLIRFRILDERLSIGGFTDISIPSDEFAGMDLAVEKVYVTENDINGLVFPKIPFAMVIFGRGYNFNELSNAAWLAEKPIRYWGDLDTHGFAILSQFRSIFPQTQSLLMDRSTLLEHREHWGIEAAPFTADLPNLSTEEQQLFDDLRFNRIQKNLRLEQEFISHNRLLEAI